MGIIARNKTLYWALIGTFTLLYLAVAFVSTLHAITFFQLANTLGLAILLGAAYEIGQAAVLFSILMTENKNRMLAWMMMFLLSALQITANVYASFKFMDASGSTDWTYWQRAILFGVQADSPEMYKVIISWISGALLPLVALGMTALVAENIRMARGEKLGETEVLPPERVEEIIENEIEKRLKEKEEPKNGFLNGLFKKKEKSAEIDPMPPDLLWKTPESTEIVGEALSAEKKDSEDEYIENGNKPINGGLKDKIDSVKKEVPKKVPKKITKKPQNRVRGWHFMNEYVDNNHDVYERGKFVGNDPSKTPTSKKA